MSNVPKTVAYICNGKASCAKKFGCFFGNPLNLGTCSHTTDPAYAKYGISEYPEIDFDRFELDRVYDNDGNLRREIYYEKEDYYSERLND